MSKDLKRRLDKIEQIVKPEEEPEWKKDARETTELLRDYAIIEGLDVEAKRTGQTEQEVIEAHKRESAEFVVWYAGFLKKLERNEVNQEE